MLQHHDDIINDDLTAKQASNYYTYPTFQTSRQGIFIQLRCAIALVSVILLFMMSFINLVIERMLEGVIFGMYLPGSLRLLLYTLPPFGMAILLTLVLVWLNKAVGRQEQRTSYSSTLGAKLAVVRPPSIGQGLVVALFSTGLVVLLWYTIAIYQRLGPSFSYFPYEGTTLWIAGIPVVTAALLTGAVIWINVIFHRTR